ncbi:Glucan endo-1,3-beta-D-glucosidase, family GH16 [Pseudoalteromonas sp. 3J6]|uniref:glycoside hydrolase family 16 protein n=1 Tax=unclassified Pseudoalteromonas TaxID=194690 RepID=UPI0015BBB4A0|nr:MULTISPECIES: glycoside hydrolase family 16 protein [unclassified Pseudoalteromonas]NWL17577.1 glycoside hydrolase family 16 protein [Pseudoalteromonas sp. Scap03]QLE83002.1 glycoside hydrolase family 16 protein [Pseudoalteromonas sp. Scap25]QLE90944.1 glycoside hydrolase family 16 protein [Pseudoalteromonas sp. Scap06]CAD2223887.1 Glucan endo-1,3-beta-D-glucosidase, family GH16 [Pseudoalteromonas sp. 3J6]
MNIETTRITRLLAAISLASLAGCGGDAATTSNFEKVDPAQPVSDWQMVWSDEFDGTSIDTNKWNFELNCAGGGNNEKQCYTDSEQNAFIKDGALNIVALPAEEGAEKPYTSARLNTRYNADFTYGRFEMRAKLPSGQGSWPAFWMMPTDEVYGTWPRSGEIDILEAVNLKTIAEDGTVEANIHGTLHYGREWPNNSSSGKAYTLPEGMNPADDFHTYAIEWQEGEIRWYVDGYLYATQRRSEVRYNSKDEAVGLKHKGWFAEYFEQGNGELTTHWDNAPFDKDFYLILNNAVGGDWPENVNNLGVDAAAFAEGQSFEVDYVRVYQCAANTDTGKGCETVRPGYDSLDDALVEGKAPVPTPPSDGIARNLDIFNGTLNANWIAWDCCGGTTPETITDAEKGDAIKFNINDNNGTVLGFSTRGGHFPDDFTGTSSPFDASLLLDLNGRLTFDMKVVTPPTSSTTWLLKAEAGDGGPNTGDVALSDSVEGVTPVTGQWQTYTFPLSLLQERGLDLSAIDVLMVFPAWQTGEGAEYLITNVAIEGDVGESPSVDLFTDGQNLDWPMWDCCGGSTPTEVMDDAEHGLTAEFTIGEAPTVMGFNTRSSAGGSGTPFDATSILENGLLQFDVKVMSNPNNPDATWLMKIESNEGDTAVELPLTDAGDAPIVGEWKTYTFTFADLAGAGLDVSAIDVVMIFPAWGTGEGAVYRVDNAKMYDPSASAGDEITIFQNTAADMWSIWDCCGGSTPTEEIDDADHGTVAEFVIGSAPTVMGFLADDGISFDASAILANGVVQFEMKVVTPPNNPDAVWTFKIESTGAATAVELPLSQSVEGEVPVNGQWQTYTFTLQSLFAAGLDISDINVLMMFPAWGTGEGAVYRIDNVIIANP